MSSTAHLYGWNDEASCLECVRDDKQPVLCLGMQDCVILSSQDNQAITLHRRYDEDCGLLEKCFSSRPNDLVITKFSNSNNHGVYVDSSNTVWSYDHDLNRVESSTGSTSATILAFNGQVASTNIEKGPEDGNEESIEQQLLVQIQKSKDCMFANHRHNLIASTMLIKQIATGTSHCLLLTQSCELYSFGTGSCGELGIGTTIPHTNEPQRVVFHGNLGVKYVAAGAYYSAAITTDGVLFTFGCGAYYRLGHGSDANCNVPKKVEALEGVGQLLPDGTSTGISLVACGVWHTVAVAADTYDVYSWGWNKFNQCGTGLDPMHHTGTVGHGSWQFASSSSHRHSNPTSSFSSSSAHSSSSSSASPLLDNLPYRKFLNLPPPSASPPHPLPSTSPLHTLPSASPPRPLPSAVPSPLPPSLPLPSSLLPIPLPPRAPSEALSEPRRVMELDSIDLLGDDDVSGILGSNNGFFPAHTVNTASPPTSAARMYGAESVRARVLYDCGKDTDIRPLSGTDGSVCGGEGGDNNDQKGNYNDNKNSNDDLNYSNDSHCDTELHDCDMQILNTEICFEKSKTRRKVSSIEDRQRIFKKSKKKSKIVAMTSCLWSLAFLVKFE